MGVSSSPEAEPRRTAHRSIRFTFAAMVGVPVVCLALLWGLAVAVALHGQLVGRGFSGQNHRQLAEFAMFAGAGLVSVLASVTSMGSFARRISREVSGLEAMARGIADEQLPQLTERLRRGDPAAHADASTLRAAAKTTEVVRVAEAIVRLRRSRAAAALGEAGMREGIRQVVVSLARRNQSLLQRQLRLIDALEQKASDPAALADLFPLDHLATRMRRHAESLIVLSGAAPGRFWTEPVPVIDIIRGAAAEVEDYKRVRVVTRADDAVAGSAVAAVTHLLAELIENATLFSPSDTQVEVRAERVANGLAIEIDDRGLGIAADQLGEFNQQLATPPDFDIASADRLGLFVVARLAIRHDVQVSLRPSPYGGTTAIVLIPSQVVALGAAETAAAAASQPAPDTYRGLPRRVRQAGLSPHLRDGPQPHARPRGATPGLAKSGTRSPEQARDLMASLQSGWQRGRQGDAADTQPDTGAPTSERQDAGDRHDEEA